jgi:hypothetical protein
VAAAEFFRAAHNVKKGLAANEAASAPAPQPQQNGPSWSQQGSQQQAPPAQQGEGKTCIHGPMTYRSGTKNGKAWSAYFCPTPKGSPNQCAPVWG